MGKKLISLIVAAIMLLCAQGAGAALKSKKQAAANPEAAYNPNPDAVDLELPMPDGQKLILRAVAIPGKGPLDDEAFKIGLVNPDFERSFYEMQIPVHVSAPFRQENFPAAWKDKLPSNEKDSYSYYLIGKYELTNGQWAAVTGEELTEQDKPETPKTNISWYDIQDFLRKYNEWLLKNHPDALPAIDGVPGYLRLPTEMEWEYAARAGYPEEQLKNPDFPDESDEHEVEDFAIFGSRYDNKMPIGSRMPNRLGIYDMAGNVSELVQNGFRFAVLEKVGDNTIARLHGSEGGLISKGGNYKASDKEQVYPGRRDEVRMFEKLPDKSYIPHREETLGARLVLTSVNVPGMARTKQILAQKDSPLERQASKSRPQTPQPRAKAGEESLVRIDVTGDPVLELEKIYAVTTSPLIKSNLTQYKQLIQGQNEALNRERSNNLLNQIRSGAYKADSLANIAFRCFQLQLELEKFKKAGLTPPEDLKKQVKAEMERHFKNLKVATNIYKQSVNEVAVFSKQNVDDKILQLKKEYSGNDQLNKLFRLNLDNFGKNVDFVRKNGVNKLQDSVIWSQTIPGKKSLAIVMELDKSAKSSKK